MRERKMHEKEQKENLIMSEQTSEESKSEISLLSSQPLKEALQEKSVQNSELRSLKVELKKLEQKFAIFRERQFDLPLSIVNDTLGVLEHAEGSIDEELEMFRQFKINVIPNKHKMSRYQYELMVLEQADVLNARLINLKSQTQQVKRNLHHLVRSVMEYERG